MRILFTFMCVLALGVMGCGETTGDPGGSGGSAGMGGGGVGGDVGTGGTDLCEGVTCEDDGDECTVGVCDPADGSCDYPPVEDGTLCAEGLCIGGECGPIGSVFPCTEQGIRAAIATGGGPYTFSCNGPATVVTKALIRIDNNVILDGEGDLTVDGNLSHTVFLVSNVAAELRGFVVTGGLGSDGGGIVNVGTLSVTDSVVSGNVASSVGGGIYTERGTLTLTNAVVSENEAQFSGGGVYSSGSVVVLLSSQVSGNTGGREGGGLSIHVTHGPASVTLSNSTVSSNTASIGGGIYIGAGTLVVSGSTISDNTASGGDFFPGGGGGIFTAGHTTLTNSTVSGNVVQHQQGLGLGAGLLVSCGGHLTVMSSTVATNSTDMGSAISARCFCWGSPCEPIWPASVEVSRAAVQGDCSRDGEVTWVSNGYNIESPGDTCGFDQATDLFNVADLNLGPLADNGGSTETHALGEGSVAIDQIPADMCEVDEDQRGVERPQGPACDVGAFELEVAP